MAEIINVVLNGKTVLPNFDVFSTAGAAFKAVIREFLTTPDSNGNITIAYNYGSVGNPLANGIEVIPIANGISIDSGSISRGNFVADTDFAGGHADTFTNAVDVTGVSSPAPRQSTNPSVQGTWAVKVFLYTIPNLTGRPLLHHPLAFCRERLHSRTKNVQCDCERPDTPAQL